MANIKKPSFSFSFFFFFVFLGLLQYFLQNSGETSKHYEKLYFFWDFIAFGLEKTRKIEVKFIQQ